MRTYQNPKARGERGQRITIGELAKIGIDVAIPLSDNLPWDLIIIFGGKLLKAQVKSSSRIEYGSTLFYLRSNNWHKGEIYHYSEKDCDIILLCDYKNVYVIGPEEFSGRSSINIRTGLVTRNKQHKKIHRHEDYILSVERLRKITGIEGQLEMSEEEKTNSKIWDHLRKPKNFCSCGKKIGRKAKMCVGCYSVFQRKVERPAKEVLLEQVEKLGNIETGKLYGVSEKTIRDWVKSFSSPENNFVDIPPEV
jgi:hypothetical protein